MANMVCEDGDGWLSYKETVSLCYGDEEECITVQFKGTDLKGEKGFLLIDRSWESRELTLIRRIDEIKKYEGDEVDWTVRIDGLMGYETSAKAKIEICYEDPQSCPKPTVSIPSVSTYTPMSGDPVDFTSYASGGVGQSITSKEWDFGDGTTSTEDDPTKIWENTSGEKVDYTVTFTATNDCGETSSTTTVITVASPPKRTGIEIQLSDTLDGKELVVATAIKTIGDLWWSGPAIVDGILWNGGRCSWSDIDSKSKYMVSVGEPCPERNPIDGIQPENPEGCAGEFADGASVVIIARNPGFDFRVYSSGHIHTLSGSSLTVLYLDSTGGDVIDEAFTGKVCGWMGIAAGSECDAFWAEFYDPIFVANYMSIMSTGEDMFGNEKELGWIDHVAFVASLIGSLPIFNLFPFAGVVKHLGEAVVVLARKTTTLIGDELSKAGGAMADICVNSPKVIQNLIQSELDEVRAALVKVYGDVQGNRYVDEALGIVKTLVDEAYELVKNADATADDLATFNQLLTDNAELGGELTTKYTNALTGTPINGVNAAINNHAASSHTGDIIAMYNDAGTGVKSVLASKVNLFKKIEDDYNLIKNAEGATNAQKWVRSWAKTDIKILKQPNHVAAGIPDALDEYVHTGHILADDLPKETIKVPDNFADTPQAEWRAAAIESEQSFSEACWEIWEAMKDSAKLSNVEKMVALSLGFAAIVLGGIYKYTSSSKDQPAKYAVTHAQFSSELASTYWACDSAEDDRRWADLSTLIAEYSDNIKEAEEDLEFREAVLKSDGTYSQFAETLQLHKFNLNHFIHALNEATNTGTLKVGANVKGFYAQLDEEGDLVSDWQSGEVIFNGVSAGEHHAFLTKGGYTSCTTPSGTVTPGNITEVRCDLAPGACILPVPTIDAPIEGVARKGVQFKSSTTTDSIITWLEWDFGDGKQSRQQNPSHQFWDPGLHTVQLTVTDDCGSATVTHTIVIESSGELPAGTPTPTDTPDPDLPAGTATVTVKRPRNAEKDEDIVWPIDCFVYIDGQYTNEEAPHPFSFGGWKELPIEAHTFKVVAEGFQDKSVDIDLKVGDEIDWIPYMDPVGYVPPVDPPITDTPVTDQPVTDQPVSREHAVEFLIPPGAVMTLTPITTVPHIKVNSTFTDTMQRISER